MIRLLYDTTINGVRLGKGSILALDSVTEARLLSEGDADRKIDFSSVGLLPLLIAQSYAAVTRTSDNATDTSVVTLSSVTIPGGTMNFNGELVVTQDWKYTNSATTKTLAMDWNGLNVSAPTATTTARANYRISIKNLNSLSSQSIFGNTTFGVAAGDPMGFANTAEDVVVDHKCRWSANVSGESIALLGYSIWYYPGRN
jgi:hypothetical protein